MAEPPTGRELEVLRLLAAGQSNQRTARDLVMALDTVKKRVTHGGESGCIGGPVTVHLTRRS